MSASRLRWFAHANVNVTDLDRSERFYTEVLGLRLRGRTAPSEPQDGAGFAMPGVMVQWRGAFFGDRRDPGPLVDMLQWTLPPTEGPAAGGLTQLGHSALRFAVTDLAAALDAAGGPAEHLVHRGPDRRQGLAVVHDPDGTRIELVEAPTGPEYRGVRLNCSDLDRSIAFYRDAIGLEAGPVQGLDVERPDGQPVGQARTAPLAIPGHPEGFTIELTEWTEPAPTGAPPAAGNHPGIYRVAIAVAGIDAAHLEVAAALPDAPPPVDVVVFDDGPVVRASFYPDPDGAVIEYLEVVPA
jgi:catechol 2,3-dioxygenase-like lactoylglutathione lyase family enzyme